MKKGFTLIEIVLTILIIAIISATATISINNFNNDKNTKQEIINTYNKINTEGKNVIRGKTSNITISGKNNILYINGTILSGEYIKYTGNTTIELNKTGFSGGIIKILSIGSGYEELANINIKGSPINEVQLERTGEFSKYNNIY